MSRRMQAGAALAVIVAALVVSSFTTTTAQVAVSPDNSLTRIIEGNYRVLYDLVLADRTTRSDRVEQVKRVELHPEYIVIVDQSDVGRVVPMHALQQFRWEPS